MESKPEQTRENPVQQTAGTVNEPAGNYNVVREEITTPGIIGIVSGVIGGLVAGRWFKVKALKDYVIRKFAAEENLNQGPNENTYMNFFKSLQDKVASYSDEALAKEPGMKETKGLLDKLSELAKKATDGPDIKAQMEFQEKRAELIINKMNLSFSDADKKGRIVAFGLVAGIAIGTIVFGVGKWFTHNSDAKKEQESFAATETMRRQKRAQAQARSQADQQPSL